MDALERCLHQVFRGEERVSLNFAPGQNGRGDCSVCKYDPGNNRHCSSHYLIHVYVVEVVDEEKTPRP